MTALGFVVALGAFVVGFVSGIFTVLVKMPYGDSAAALEAKQQRDRADARDKTIESIRRCL